MKFWQKTYMLTLLIFVTVLGASVFLYCYIAQSDTLMAQQSKSTFTHIQIENSLGQALGTTTNKKSIVALGEYYQSQNIDLSVKSTHEDGDIFTCLPQQIEWPQYPENADVIVSNTIMSPEGSHYLIHTSLINEDYILTTMTDISETYQTLSNRNLLAALICMLSSVIVTFILYFVLKALTKPLIQLSSAADEIAGGNLTLRAESKGNDEIAQLASSLNNMADSLVSEMETLEIMAIERERISDNLSHEIRTPLTAIHGYAEFMQLANLSEKDRMEALQYIMEESDRLQKISSRMLMLSEMRRDEIDLKPTKLHPVIRHCAISITAKAAEKGVKFEIAPVPTVYVMGDDILLESLIGNLCENAVKACTEGQQVALNFYKLGENIVIQISDNGIGISQEDIKRLGEPFYRPDKARSRKEGGAGLGISLCKQIASLHGTKLVYHSEPGQGTTVEIKLSLVEDKGD